MTVRLPAPKLKDGAIPHYLPNCPKYLSTSTTTRETPDDKRRRIEMKNVEEAIQESLQAKASYDEERQCKSFEDLKSKINNIHFPKGWTVIVDIEKVMFLSIEINPTPVIKKCILIDSGLNVSAYYKNVALTKVSKFIFPFTLSNTNEVLELLQHLELVNKDIENCNVKSVVSVISDCLNILKKFMPESQENFNFLFEQICLISDGKHNFKYSSEFLIFCSLLYSISPHSYKFLRNSNLIILPHPYTIYRICSSFNLNPVAEQFEENFLAYIKQRYKVSQPQDRTVCLMMDEIHIKPLLDYKGGNIVGNVYDSEKCATSAYVFMLQSFLSTYKDVAYIMPVQKINAENLFNVIKKVIIGLEEIGFKVICVSSDNNAINGKAMSFFNSPPKQSIVYKHPVDFNKPLFFIYDPVHILKCIRNNWLNQKNAAQCMYYPDFEGNDIIKTASFGVIKKIHSFEAGNVLKYAYGVTLKALLPTPIERQNVKLVLQIFNDHMIEGLREFEKNNELQHCQETADYIRIIYTWWSIMNVKSLFKGQCKRNVFQEPLYLCETDEKNIFLNKFLFWLDNWKSLNFVTGTLTRETHSALRHTTYAVLELLSYCVNELGFSYILTGKIQTDALEQRFGKFRQLAGSQYLVSLRQVFEIESKLRLQNIGPLKIKSSKYGELPVDIHQTDLKDLETRQMTLPTFAQSITVSDNEMHKICDIIPILSYVAGYSAFATLKKLCKCTSCSSNLITENVTEAQENSFIERMDRGGLIYPHPKVLNIVIHIFIIVQKLLSIEFEHMFLNIANQRHLVVNLALSILSEKEIFIAGCSSGHSSTLITRFLIIAATNTFLKNYCKDRNDIKKIANHRKHDTFKK